MTMPKVVVPVEMQSFKLSCAAARSVPESIFRSSLRLKALIHSLTKMDKSSPPMTKRLKRF